MRKVFWLFLLLFLASVAWHFSLQNHSDFMKEIESYRNGKDNPVDLSPVVQKHLTVNMDKEEVLYFFENAGFRTWVPHHRPSEKSNDFDEVYIAHFSAPTLIPIIPIYENYQFTMFFKADKLVKCEGNVRSESP